ncbi:unnamed protein product [Spirodela intermedia]|uniref:Uncharacterized protein n=1 Tax=Spirodela intermedia TaxID=51605 RepID=A0A7I8JWE8_SPIIN|nr:unnamed protein product [Spirodela intermedia]
MDSFSYNMILDCYYAPIGWWMSFVIRC